MTKLSGKHALMQMLKAEGVKYIFGNPGTSEAAIMEALENYPELEYILVVQEAVAIGMADAYARATGNVGFVSLHIDNGLANAFALLVDSKNTGTPLVITAGNKDVRKLAEGRSDLVRMAEPFTKWSAEITHPEQYPAIIRRAFNEAKTPPRGPVFISFSANSLDDEADVEIVPSTHARVSQQPDFDDVKEAAHMLAHAQHPIMIVGDRVGEFDGVEEAVKVAELTGATVYGHLSNQVNFPTSHPQYAGPLSLRQPDARAALDTADVVLLAGTAAFSDFFHQPGSVLKTKTKLIHIDINASEVGKSEPTDLGIVASPKMALDNIGDAIKTEMTGYDSEAARDRAQVAAELSESARNKFLENAESHKQDSPMNVASMFNELSKSLPNDTIIFDDAISNKGTLNEALKFDKPGSMFGQRGGSIGWGVGAGMGIQLANPDRPVVTIVGDGSAMMSVQGLWTAVNSKIPVIYVICNNAMYRVLKLNMQVYKRLQAGEQNEQSKYIGMDFPTPFDFSSIAKSFGAYGERVEHVKDIGPAFQRAIASGGPAVLDMIVDGSV